MWTYQQPLPTPIPAGNQFGNSVAISGERIVVGAFRNDDACLTPPDTECDTGAAYVFERGGGSPMWIETRTLTASVASGVW